MNHNELRPQYQKLIEEGYKVLPKAHAKTLEKKIVRWAEYADIKEEFQNRPDDVGVEEMIFRLSRKYNYSTSNVNKIVYLL